MTSGIHSRDGRKLRAERTGAVQVIETQLAVLVRLLDHQSRRAITYKEMDRASYLIARALDRVAPVSIHNLAKTLSLEPTTVTRKIASMEAAELITRSTFAEDKRVSLIQLSQIGRKKMEAVRDLRQRHNEILLSDWPVEELTTFGELMRRYNDCIDHNARQPVEKNQFY